MSEPRETVDLETNEVVDDEVEDTSTDEASEDDADDERPAKPPVDWEKRAHDREGAMARERSRRRAAERTVTELNERLDRLEAASKKTGGHGSRREQLIASLRDDIDEPLTDVEQLKEIARTLLEEEREQAEAEDRQAKQTQQVNRLTRQMGEYEADFRLDHKDYDKACEFYKGARTEELEEMGYSGDRLMTRLAREMYGLVDDTLKADRDPAEAVYALAKRRGFDGTVDDATRKLQKLQNGAKAGTTPRGTPSGTGRVTYDQVTRAKGKDRDVLWEKLRKQEKSAKV